MYLETTVSRISVERASELTGLSKLTIRKGIENGDLDFGKAIHTGKKRNTYHISPAKLAEYLGMSIDEVKGECSWTNYRYTRMIILER